MTDRDMTKVPVWARQLIAELTRDLNNTTDQRDELLRRLKAGPADSNVFADPYSEVPRPLGRDTMVRFGTTEEGAFHAEPGGDGLEVSLYALNAMDLVIVPLSANSVMLRKVRRKS